MNVLTRRHDTTLRMLVLAWVLSASWCWLWWLSPARGPWQPGRMVATGLLFWLFAVYGYFLCFAVRMKKPNPAQPLPILRVAMIATKAPSEPWPVVQRTLLAMLAQDMPYHYDVWLADERPDHASREWCRDHGVHLISRQHVADYHQDEWPRRTRCKEGNLAYFYDRFGYRMYDVVSQLDADHVPAPTYLACVTRPFTDQNVGYVAAPSIDDANATSSWAARARLFREATMHGPAQAGANRGWGPICIGSHYAVRTRALHSAGGLGPELAEDFTTTLGLQARGWDGVFAIDAEAHGDGPAWFDDLMVQEIQWARSLGSVMTRWAPQLLPQIPRRARMRLRFVLLWYLLQGAAVALAAGLPTIGLLTGTPWNNATLSGFYAHLWPSSLAFFSILALLRRAGTLRPVNAKLWSLEPVVFQLVRWPWTTAAFLTGMRSGHRRESPRFSVTPKRPGAAPCLRVRFLLPALLLALVPCAVIGLTDQAEQQVGLALLAGLQAGLYLLACATVVVLHARDASRIALTAERHGRWRAATGASARAGAAVALVAGICVLAVALRLHES